jgi:hypothetical protein
MARGTFVEVSAKSYINMEHFSSRCQNFRLCRSSVTVTILFDDQGFNAKNEEVVSISDANIIRLCS